METLTKKSSSLHSHGSYIEHMFQAKYGGRVNNSLKRSGTLPARHENRIGNSSEEELPIRRSRSLNLDADESSSSQKKAPFSSSRQKTTTSKKRASTRSPKRSSGHQRGGEKKSSRSSEKTNKRPSSTAQRGSKSGSKQTTRKTIKSRTTTTRRSLHLENHNSHNHMSMQSLPEIMPVSSNLTTSHDMSFKSLPDMHVHHHQEEEEASSSSAARISDIDKVLMLPQAALLSLLQKSEGAIGSTTTSRDLHFEEDESFEQRLPGGSSTKKLRKIHSLPTSLDEQRRSMDRSASSTSVRMPRRRTIDDVIPDLRDTTEEPNKKNTNNSRQPPANLRSSTGSIPKEAIAGPLVNPWIAQLGRSAHLSRTNSEDHEQQETRSGLAAISA